MVAGSPTSRFAGPRLTGFVRRTGHTLGGAHASLHMNYVEADVEPRLHIGGRG
jgi:hypothetical protein